MGRAAARKRAPKPDAYAGGILDHLMVVMPFGELGYSRYHMMLQTLPDYGYLLQTGRVIAMSGSEPHQAAQDLATEALKIKGWTRLLFMEHDHEYPADVYRRHAQYTQPIVGGMYFLRDVENPLPVFYMWDKGRGNALIPDAATVNQIINEPGLYPMDCVPLGCTSIAREVLEQWPSDKPFFSSFTNHRGAHVSHDVFFCRVAQDAGWQAYLDSRIAVSHYALVPIDKAYFVRWWNQVGAAKAQKDAIKRSLEVVPGQDGSKKTRVMVAHTKDGLDPATRAALEATGQGLLFQRVEKDDDYFLLVAAHWAAGETFVSCEQDIVPAPGQVEELLACPEEWCAYAYEYPPIGLYAGMGLAKFSQALLARLPDAMRETASWHDAQHPPMHWCRVDGWLKQWLTEHGAVQHVHGTVEHHHKGRPAHGCEVAVDQPAETPKSRFSLVTT